MSLFDGIRPVWSYGSCGHAVLGHCVACASRYESPPSTEMFQMERCTPVPCGPDECTVPFGLTIMFGSPYAWIGSTMRGTPNVGVGVLDAGDGAAVSVTPTAAAA